VEGAPVAAGQQPGGAGRPTGPGGASRRRRRRGGRGPGAR
jgi:hypothetical protein